jgi:hypothetical protein
VIYVGGGNTKSMLALGGKSFNVKSEKRITELDAKLMEVSKNTYILMRCKEEATDHWFDISRKTCF